VILTASPLKVPVEPETVPVIAPVEELTLSPVGRVPEARA
jgi:hypothetical protein